MNILQLLLRRSYCIMNHTVKRDATTLYGALRPHIVWMDLEMTGLDVRNNRILEMACIVTDDQLNMVAEGPNLIVKQSDELLNNMDEWCTETHNKSGLLEQVQKSTLTEQQAEFEMLQFLQKYTKPQLSPLAGNTIYMDRLFLSNYMPQLNAYMHYRLIDVSSIKELCKRWNPIIYANAPKKRVCHRGLDDIRESIIELKYYKQFMFT